MKIAIIGYKNHALRLKSLLKDLGYNKIINFNYHTDKESSISDSDIFFIATPNHTHIDWINKLEGYNKYIFCEKPPAVNKKELNKIKEYKENIYFNFNYRFSYLVKVIEEYNQTKELGRPIYINCLSTHGIAFKDSFKNNWRFKNNNTFSSIMGTVGIHYIDLISYLFGPINNLNIQSLSVVSKNLPDTYKLTFCLENCFSDIFLSYSAPFTNKIIIIYENGIIELSNGTISVSKPRDTYDERGFFTAPKKEIFKQFNNSRDYYNDSLLNSIKYFLHYAKNNIDIPMQHYNQSIQSNKILLDIQKNSIDEL